MREENTIYYFLDGGLSASGSGIEHAIKDRINLFKEAGHAPKIVTVYSNTFLHNDLKNFGFNDQDSLNLFEYFQGTLDVPVKNNRMGKYVPTGEDARQFDARNGSAFYVTNEGHGDFLMFQVNIETLQMENLVEFVNGKRKSADSFDPRGFKSVHSDFDHDDKITRNTYYNLEGDVVIESHYHDKHTESTLYNYHGHDYEFKTNDELIAFFLNEIATDDVDYFWIDRLEYFYNSLDKLDQHIKLIGVLHNVHLDVHTKSGLNQYFEDYILHPGTYDALVSATPQQTTDIKKIVHTTAKTLITTVPVGYVNPDAVQKIPESDRTKHNMIAVARLFPEKRLDLMLQVFKRVHDRIPDATLDIYGYGDKDTPHKLNVLRQKLKIVDEVGFKGYATDLNASYNNAQIFLLTSQTEGFVLATLEALSHGLPAFAFDINYGPASMINNGENGYLFKFNDIDGMAKQIIEVLENDDQLQTLSDNAYRDVEPFYSENVWKKWENVIDDIKQMPPHIGRPDKKAAESTNRFSWKIK